MTPYRERREKGVYDPAGKGTKSTTTDNLSGLGAPQKAEPKRSRKVKGKEARSG